MPVGAVAELARCLSKAGHEDLAMRVGFAVDMNRRHLALTRDDRDLIVDTLADCPASLAALHDALRSAAYS